MADNDHTLNVIQNTVKEGHDSNAALMQLAAVGNQLVNLLTRLITGLNYNPQQHGTMGVVGSLIAQTKFAQMLGIDNPMHRVNVAKDISGMLYGYDNDPARKIHQIRVMESLNDYNAYSEAQGNKNIYRTDRMTQEAIAHYLTANGDITPNNIEGLGQKDSKVTKAMSIGEKVVSIGQKVMGMGDDVEAIMNTAKAVAGTNDFSTAADTFVDYISKLIQSGMSLSERMNALAMTTRMTKNLQSQTGMSASEAASISRESVGNATTGAVQARRLGIQNYDTVQVANNLANLQKEANTDPEGLAKLAATRAIIQSDKSEGEKQKLLEKVRSGDINSIKQLMQSSGLSDSFSVQQARAESDPNYLMNIRDADTLKEMQKTAKSNLDTIIKSKSDKFYKDNVNFLGMSKTEKAVADKVKAAMDSGKGWDKITSKDLDIASAYLTDDAINLAIGNIGKTKGSDLKKGKEAIEGMVAAGPQYPLLQGVTSSRLAEVLKDPPKKIGSMYFDPDEFSKPPSTKVGRIDKISDEVEKNLTLLSGNTTTVSSKQTGQNTQQETSQSKTVSSTNDDAILNILIAIKTAVESISKKPTVGY